MIKTNFEKNRVFCIEIVIIYTKKVYIAYCSMNMGYYSPVVGRFTQQDVTQARRMNVFDPYGYYQSVVLVGGVMIDMKSGKYILDDPLSLNYYTYCSNNPNMFRDYDGNFGTPISWAMTVIAGIAGGFFGNYLADQMDLHGWKRAALIAGVAVGGAVVGFIAGEALVGFTSAFLMANLDIMFQLPAPVLWALGLSNWAQNYGSLSRAAEFGFQAYNTMQGLIKGSGLFAHHIIEQRFGFNIDITVAVTKSEHQIFTNAWRALVPYGTNYASLTVAQIWGYAQQVYKDYPAILKEVYDSLFGGK